MPTLMAKNFFYSWKTPPQNMQSKIFNLFRVTVT